MPGTSLPRQDHHKIVSSSSSSKATTATNARKIATWFYRFIILSLLIILSFVWLFQDELGYDDDEWQFKPYMIREKKKINKSLNILLLYADDWRYDTLSAAGNPIVKTPILDALAKSGVRFTHNCVTTSVCWISRMTLYTGQYMSRHNTTKMAYWNAPINQTIHHMLLHGNNNNDTEDDGKYYVGHAGKWGVYGEHAQYHLMANFSVDENGWHTRRYNGKRWHITEKNEADALRFLRERPKDKPFFLNVAFFATHAVDSDIRQYIPMNSSLGLYNESTTIIPTPITDTEEDWMNMPHFFHNDWNEGRTRYGWRYDTPPKRQQMMKNYYRMATEVDTACGVILDELRDQGVLDETLVIFTTDNGNFHGEHGLADKWYPHQESIRVPLIVRDPRMKEELRGTTMNEFTLNVDLAPTIVTAAGLDPLPGMMGRDFSVLYRDMPSSSVKKTEVKKRNKRNLLLHTASTQIKPWRKEFFYEHPIIYDRDFIPASEALVQRDWKYFYWPDFGYEQLFHIKEDPMERNDLINSTEGWVVKKKKNMKKKFWKLRKMVKDDGVVVL